MKAKKALKRLKKIEALISDVTNRSSTSASQVRDALQDAKAAVGRAKEALKASARTAENPLVKPSEPPLETTPEPSQPKRRLSAGGRAAIVTALKKRWDAKKASAAKAVPVIAKKATVKRAAAAKAARAVANKATVKAAPQKAAKSPTRKVARKAPAKKAVRVVQSAEKPAPPKIDATVKPPDQAVPKAPVQ